MSDSDLIYGTSASAPPSLDSRDQEILAKNQLAFDRRIGPRVGDFVIFADNVTRRISHVWDFPDTPIEDRLDEWSYQTSDGGSWHFSGGGCSFSGGLYTGVKLRTLIDTCGTRKGAIWFFHHDFAGANRGVYTEAIFRVYSCTEPAPR